MSFTQANRYISLTSPLGEDVLIVQGFRAREALSTPFQLELDLVSVVNNVPFDALLGQPVTVSLRRVDGSYRYFHGRVSQLLQVSRNAEGLVVYRAEVVPWLWFLTLTRDCRIFQNKSVQDIVSQVFRDHGFSDFEFRGLSGGQEPREYCVQYRESAFNFVSRLLEEEGIYYYFEHSADKHLLVLADSPAQHPVCPGQATARYELGSENATRDDDVVFEAVWGQQVQPGKVALGDFNFEMPSTSLGTELESGKPYEDYDYPGLYDNRARGEVLARLRLEQHQVAGYRLQGRSSCRAFCPGYRFELAHYFRTDVEPAQVLVSVVHEARQSLSSLAGSEDTGFEYHNTFESFPHSRPFRPPLTARKPRVAGTQTAVVVGKSGEEIWTDRYGRVKVQFYWDRRGKMDENSSCWVRVSHHWAGKEYGAFFLPRIGQEVIVDFLEGDPDRPIIIGRVYNAEQTAPYTLPNEQTKSTIKSNSSKGGNGFNELRFEDKAGEEEIFLHAQKDLNETILHNHSTTVTASQSTSVGGDQSNSVNGKQSISIKGDRDVVVLEGNEQTSINTGTSGLTVKGDRTEVVQTGNYSQTIQTGNRDVNVDTGNDTLTVKTGNRVVNVNTGDSSLTVSTGNRTVNVNAGNDDWNVLTGNCTISVNSGNHTVTVKSGNHGINVNAGKFSVSVLAGAATIDVPANALTLHGMSVAIKADTTLSLEVGGNKIAIDPSGITIQGQMVNVSGSLVNVSASGPCAIAGAVVTVN